MATDGAAPRCECPCGCRAKVDVYVTSGVARKRVRCSSCAAGTCAASTLSTADLREREKALRQAALPHVEALVAGLVAQGMTKEKACKTVRWATYTLEGRK